MGRSRKRQTRVGQVANPDVLALQEEVQALRRELTTLASSVTDQVELALMACVHTSTADLIVDARRVNWRVRFGRRGPAASRGTIFFEHPTDEVHNCTLDLPLPDDAADRRAAESRIRIRLGVLRAA